MHHNAHHSDNHEPTQSDYLIAPQILPLRVKPAMTVAELIDPHFRLYIAPPLQQPPTPGHHPGTKVRKTGAMPEYSVPAQAAGWNVPIYTASPGAWSIGMNVARNALDGSLLTLDPLADVNETPAIVLHATRNGVIILGGGSPKNFYLQTQPQLWEVLGVQKGGHNYFIQITADAPHWR